MPSAQQLRVLVVDDTSVSRMLVCESLWSFGVKDVTLAQDGVQAMQQMQTRPSHLVLSDFNMPNMDGLQLLKTIRETPPIRNTGFILITGRGDKSLIEQGKKLALNNYLPKPFTTQSLRACIEQVVGKIT